MKRRDATLDEEVSTFLVAAVNERTLTLAQGGWPTKTLPSLLPPRYRQGTAAMPMEPTGMAQRTGCDRTEWDTACLVLLLKANGSGQEVMEAHSWPAIAWGRGGMTAREGVRPPLGHVGQDLELHKSHTNLWSQVMTKAGSAISGRLIPASPKPYMVSPRWHPTGPQRRSLPGPGSH